MKNGKKKPFVLRVLKGFFILLCTVFVAISCWIAFSAFDRISPLRAVPRDYSLFIHTDSVWDAVSPVLDLKAVDVLLAEPSFSDYRSGFIQLRSSGLRNNKYAKFAASRRVDAALYTSGDTTGYVAVVDMSFLSAVTRLADILGPHLKIDGLTYTAGSSLPHYEYRTAESTLFFKQERNLLIIANSIDMLMRSAAENNETEYTQDEKKNLTAKNSETFRIVADAGKLAQSVVQGNETASEIASYLTKGAHSVISFAISDSDINIKADFPVTLPADGKSPLVSLLSKNSRMPALLTKLGDPIQYYTIVNAGSLPELKDAVFPFVENNKNVVDSWNKAESLCKTLFSLSLEDILFSWTGTEYAVLGIEGNSDPVFALQIQDEQQREKIFDSIISSFAVENRTNLIIGGVRVPCLALPPFLQDVLASFNIELPHPYYLIQNGYIYFSESPQNLSSIYNAYKSGRMLARKENWKTVSDNQNSAFTIGMYYDLQRSVPFFLENGTIVSKILKLYNIGRCDFRIKNNVLTCQLHATVCPDDGTRLIPGFPLPSGTVQDYNLQSGPVKNSGAVFWVENGKTVKALEFVSMKQSETMLPDSCTIASASEETSGGGVLWAVTSNGAAYLLNRQLECLDGFPVVTGALPSAKSAAYKNGLLIPSRDGSVIFVRSDGTYGVLPVAEGAVFKSAPAVLGETAAIYSKSFKGSIYLIKKDACVNAGEPMKIDGIGFGRPALAENGHTLYTAFITQAGLFYLFSDGKTVSGFPVQIDDVFYTNVVYCNNFFFALSQDALLYRIGFDGSFISIKIPDAVSARQGFVAAVSSDGHDDVYVCADGNILHGFSPALEVLRGFPVAGCSIPVFADINGDRNDDCLVLSADKRLYAWNLK
jgi:hypothetical protein